MRSLSLRRRDRCGASTPTVFAMSLADLISPFWLIFLDGLPTRTPQYSAKNLARCHMLVANRSALADLKIPSTKIKKDQINLTLQKNKNLPKPLTSFLVVFILGKPQRPYATANLTGFFCPFRSVSVPLKKLLNRNFL